MDGSIDSYKAPYAAPSSIGFTINVRDA